MFRKMDTACDFERTSSWYNCLIIINVFNCSETVSSCFFDHRNSVLIWTLDKNCAWFRIFYSCDEGKFILTKSMFTNFISITEILRLELFNRVYCRSSTSQDNSFHITSLSSSESNNTLFGEHFKTNRVDSFLVNNDKRCVITFSDFFFQLNDLLASFISKSSFILWHFFSISSIGEKELGIYFSFFILKRSIASKNMTFSKFLWHIGVTWSMI